MRVAGVDEIVEKLRISEATSEASAAWTEPLEREFK